MKKNLVIAMLFICALGMKAQIGHDRYWIQFNSKANTPYSVDEPEAFLSERAIQRRTNQGIDIVENDLPIDPDYIAQVDALPGVIVLNNSKWLNAITIWTTNADNLTAIENFSFVSQLRSVEVYRGNPKVEEVSIEKRREKKSNTAIDYGESANQIEMLNGQFLHERGFEGQGMHIALLDAGYRGVDTLLAFQHLWEDERIMGTWDFVQRDEQSIDHHNHGHYVLSVMAGILPGSTYGTATGASYYLLRTEDSESEFPIEEDNWISGAEWADSAGVDILNTSLGYSLYDDSTMNHSYASLDGNTTRITRGADIAASKGMLVVNSAGNSAATEWHYITAPADGDSVLTVGAVEANGKHAAFSSFGPTYDGRIKPNVMAQGKASIASSYINDVVSINGTSFSSPILAGMAACLWQSVPEASNMEVLKAIEKSAHLYKQPNDSMGFGIPDFQKAHEILMSFVITNQEEGDLLIYPNPFNDNFQVVSGAGFDDNIIVNLYDLTGRRVEVSANQWSENLLHIDSSNLLPGVYVLSIESSTQDFQKRIMKMR